MTGKSKGLARVRQIIGCMKDYRFSSIMVKYFLLLTICLVLPMLASNLWYQSRLERNMQEELLAQNEGSLMVARNNMEAVLKSMKNLAYNLSVRKEVTYFATVGSIYADASNNLDNMNSMLDMLLSTNEYIESVAIYFSRTGEIISDEGAYQYTEYDDNACFDLYRKDMHAKVVYESRKKENKYPYLLTILYPIRINGKGDYGAVAIDIDVEELGEFMGSGQYRNKEKSPMLMIYDGEMEQLIYSDEYRFLIDEAPAGEELKKLLGWEQSISGIYNLWDEEYVVSGIYSPQEDFRYLYLNSVESFENQKQAATYIFRWVVVLILVVCLVLAALLTFWIYRPIQQTVKVLENSEMLVEWDKKERVDEMEAIQRSILSAKEEKEDLDRQIKERVLSLHNAQICALQTQINPHFLFNSLTGIGNAAALLLGKDNVVTDMVFTLGKLMRISLSSKRYLVPLSEELEHVKLYMKIMDFRYRGKIHMHVEIPEEMMQVQIAKLTLQPLIENSIEHGLTRRHEGGNVWIEGVKQGDQIALHITDDGEGMGQKELYKLRERLMEDAVGGSQHIGLRNVNQRLKLIFGDEYGLEVNRKEGGGVCVTVHFRTL